MNHKVVDNVPVRRGVMTVAQLLGDPKLTIPVYQRPYRWTTVNVQQLLTDLERQLDRRPYRLGTVVLHERDGWNDIVDGQQRTITLMLLVKALFRHRRAEVGAELGKQLELLHGSMAPFSFSSEISQYNIKLNYLEIVRWVTRASFQVEHLDFLLNHCQVVFFALNDLSEAFQFFDSQNARGVDLEPHDLLKAFHLREFHAEEVPLMGQTVKAWEDSATEDLVRLFGDFWFRVRLWGQGRSALHFGKVHVGVFKGVNLRGGPLHPYVGPMHLANHHALQQGEVFPFQLDQVILNGRRFFEMVAHYQQQILAKGGLRTLIVRTDPSSGLGIPGRILDALESYGGRRRKGDEYVRLLFECLLLYYIDKFGAASLKPAIEKAFVWAYHLRLSMEKVQLISIDNYAREGRVFAVLRDAVEPADFLSISVSPVAEVRCSNAKELEEIFRELKYLD